MHVPEEAGQGHAVARVKASPQLDAAIRAEARAAAREEVREHFRSREVVGIGDVRFVVKRGWAARKIEAARQNESRTTTPGVLDNCQQGAGSAGGTHSAFGHAHNGGTPPNNLGNTGGLGGSEGAHAPGGPAGAGVIVGSPSAPAEQTGPGSSGVHALPVTGAGVLAVPALPGTGAGTPEQIETGVGTPVAPVQTNAGAGTPAAPVQIDTPAGPVQTGTGDVPASGVSPAVEESDRTPVEGEAKAGSPRGSAPTSAAQRSAAASSRQLPFTGADLPLLALLGASALAAGVVLRRRPAAH